MGFVISGYSHDKDHPEEYLITISEKGSSGPQLLRDENQTGAYWNGQPEAITRLLLGRSNGLTHVLKLAGLEDEKIREIQHLCDQLLGAQMIVPSMPIQDTIDLAEFLIRTTIEFTKYTPGYQTVGGPIEISTITRHEGYKWIQRKH